MRHKFKLKLPKLGLMVVVCSLILGFGLNNSKTSNVNAETPTAICQGIANDENNNIPETVQQLNPVPRYRTLLKYDGNLGDAANEVNVVSTTGQGITLNGVKLSDIPNALVDYANGTKYIRIKIPQAYQDALEGDVILEVISGTQFENKILDGAKFVLKNDKWETIKSVEFEKIEWNNIGYNNYSSMKGVLIKFNANLSNNSYEFNGGIQSTNFASTIGEHVYLGGVKLSTLPGAFVSYHSLGFLFFYADNMIAYRTMHIEKDTVALNSLLPEIKLNFIISTTFCGWSLEEKSYPSVTFTELEWNNIGYGDFIEMPGVLLEYSANLSQVNAEFNGSLQSFNLASTYGQHIYLGDTKISSISGAVVIYHSTKLLFIYVPNMTKLGILTIESFHFLDVTLPEVSLSFNGTIWEYYTGPKEKATCLGIANDENNNIPETVQQLNPVPRYRTLLKYDGNLGDAANEVNVVSTTGQGITLNGVKLSDIPNALVDYANGTKYIRIKIPQAYQDALAEEGDVFLEVINGTPFENKLLDGIKFILRNGQWAIYTTPNGVDFSSILWNNSGGDVYSGKNGVLLSYSDNLSNVSKETKGALKLTNMVSQKIGSKIKLDGVAIKDIANSEVMYFGSTFLWIYVPNMETYKELIIESTDFISVLLPETHFAFFGSSWAESYKLTHVINGVQKIEYVKKSNKTVLGQEHYQNLLSNENLSVKLVSFKVGETVYKPDETLMVCSDLTVQATVVGFETTRGASVRMTNPSQMRFETKIDKSDYDYLVNKYGNGNIETGTYIVPKTSMGLASFSQYVNHPPKGDGTDYIQMINYGFSNSSTASEDGYYKFYGVLDGILPSDYCTDYYGIGYIKVTDGDNVYNLLGGNEMENESRSVYQVIKRAYKDYSNGSKQQLMLKGYLDSVLSLVSGEEDVEIDNSIEGYTSPYTLSYNSDTHTYQVNGNSEIKTVLINGNKYVGDTSIIKINDSTYKLDNYNLNASETSSSLSFKLTSIAQASELVDFVLEMPSNREMKILQITDTQIIDSSQMRSPDRLNKTAVEMWARGKIDKNCFNHIAELIESERPDLILFTGDIVYGEFDDTGEIWTRIIDFMESFNIPWAPIFGNHDNESKKGVDWQCDQLENAKNCLFKQGNLTGNGNYSIGLTDSSGKIRRVIYMLDSNGCIRGPGIAQDQITWMEGVSSSIDTLYGENVPGFACFHIPSLDFKTAIESKYSDGATTNCNLDITGLDGDFGQKHENISLFNTSLASYFKDANIDGVFAGHDHVNNFSVLYDGIRYTYGTKTGTYDYYNGGIIGGTLIRVNQEGDFNVSHRYLNEKEMSDRTAASFTITIFSDVHHDLNDYGGFYCTESLEKLSQILEETPGSRFYISLGDAVNSCYDSLNNYYDVMAKLKEYGLNIFNNDEIGYIEGNRLIFNLLGNHEVAYSVKSLFKDYVPYVEGVGSTAVYKYEDIMFVAIDALFTRTGSDDPSDIISCTQFTIPDAEIAWLKEEIANQMDSSIKGIVWISHVALQDIDSESQTKLFNELRSYNLPITVFEGHTHIEAFRQLKDDSTGEVYCDVYTLPAVTLYDNYPYYNVTFKDGKVWYIEKHNGEI